MEATTEMQPLGRAARALADALYQLQQSVPEIDAYRHIGIGEYEPLVRAVLQAVRSPSDEMIEAGVVVADEEYSATTNAILTWQAMVDAAAPS